MADQPSENTLLGTIQALLQSNAEALREEISRGMAQLRSENEKFKNDIATELTLWKNQIAEESDSGNERVSIRDKTRRRRSSFFTPEDIPAAATVQDAKEKYTMLYQPLEITEEMRLQNLTVKGVKWLLTEKYPEYLASSLDKTRTIVDFISKPLLNELVDIQKRDGTPVSHMLSYEKIRKIPNDLATDLLAYAIRPESEEDYRMKLLKNVSECKPTKHKNWQFGVPDYDEALFGVVNKIIEEIVSYDGFFRNKANNLPPGTIPKLAYGSKDDPGAFRVFLACFGEYGENFRRYLTEDALKSLKSTHDFAELMRFANEKFAQQAKDSRRMEDRARPSVPIKETVEKIQASRMQHKLREGSALRQLQGKVQVPDTPAHNLEQAMVDPFEDSLNAVYGQRGTPVKPFSATPSFTPKPKERTLPCYNMAYTGKCEAGTECTYSHDAEVLRGFIFKEKQRVLGSPFASEKNSYPRPSNPPYSAKPGLKIASADGAKSAQYPGEGREDLIRNFIDSVSNVFAQPSEEFEPEVQREVAYAQHVAAQLYPEREHPMTLSQMAQLRDQLE